MASPRFTFVRRRRCSGRAVATALAFVERPRFELGRCRQPPHPVLRYEDLKARPVETFTAAAAFMGMTQDPAKIKRALEFSSLEELQRTGDAHAGSMKTT